MIAVRAAAAVETPCGESRSDCISNKIKKLPSQIGVLHKGRAPPWTLNPKPLQSSSIPEHDSASRSGLEGLHSLELACNIGLAIANLWV